MANTSMNAITNNTIALQESRARWSEPDLLRAFAFLGVVAQHILGAWARRQNVGPRQMALISICFELVRFAVPMFVFLYGMMLARSAARDGVFDTVRYYRRRCLQLVLPYVLWSAYYVWSSEADRSFAELPRLLLTGTAEYHLWYVPMILQFVILAPVFIRLFRRIEAGDSPLRGWILLMAIAFLWLAEIAVCGRLPQTAAGSFVWRHQSGFFLSWLVYFTAGAACGMHYEAFGRLARRSFPACLAFVLAAFALIIRADLAADLAAGSVVFNVVGLQRWYYAPVVLAVFVCLQRMAQWLAQSASLRKAASFVGRHSYRAYLCHAAFIRVFNKHMVARFDHMPVYYLLLFVVTAAASLFLAWIIDRIYDKTILLNT